MIAYLLMGFGGTLLLTAIVFVIAGLKMEEIDVVMLGFFVTPLIAFLINIPVFSAYTDHVKDLTNIKYGQEQISLIEEEMKYFKSNLEVYEGNSLFNSDKPVMASLETFDTLTKRLTTVKRDILRAKMNINSREIGLMSGVLIFFNGEEK